MPVVVFADLVREEYDRMKKSDKIRRSSIDWDSADLCLINIFEKMFKALNYFEGYDPNKVRTLRLDVSFFSGFFEDM